MQGLCGVSTDIVNADKMSGRSRKYKIIFSPQKVSGTHGDAHSHVTLCPPSLCTFHSSIGAKNCLFLTQKRLSKLKCCDTGRALGPCRALPVQSLPGPEGLPFLPFQFYACEMVLEEEGVFGGEWGHQRMPVTSQCWDPRVGREHGFSRGWLLACRQMCAHAAQPLSSARGEERESCLHPVWSSTGPVLGCCDSWGCSCPGLHNVPVLHTDVTCDEWSFYLLPLDEDIISMELPEFFRDYFLVSGTLCGGDSPSCPPCLAGAGGTVLF